MCDEDMYYEYSKKSFEELEKEFSLLPIERQCELEHSFGVASMRGEDTSGWYFHKYLDNYLNKYNEKDFFDY